ncbi:M23 family metallopeptidase [Streptacidiphilus sp. PB12-B1b]|nr:M23 family metallopeptidase [Streptacidiphilus sp. PB12-B1b]
MAAVGATGAIGLATPAHAATIGDARPTGAKPSLSVQDHATAELSTGTTALMERDATAADPGTALADRIRAQAAQQRADSDDAARRQAAQAAAAKLAAARADAEAEAHASAQHAAEAAAQAEAQEAQARAEAEAAAQVVQAEQQARAAADQQQLGTLVTPVQGAVVGAGFGQSGTYWAQLHTGLDLSAATGAPVVAIGAGTVTSAGWAGSYGYRVVETLPDGTELWYCHLSAIGVGSGEVTPGQPIGRVGATGNVSGPHLHLEVRPGGGEPVDPAQWLSERGLSI